jgi:hypothetical protein
LDFRTKYYLEAIDNIRESQKCDPNSVGYWANISCAVANALMATISDDLAEEVLEELGRRARVKRQNQRRTQARIKRDLKKT